MFVSFLLPGNGLFPGIFAFWGGNPIVEWKINAKRAFYGFLR